MRTIQLEILRKGPPHNQLLSPLTEYLALCENHPAVTVRVPFEHAEFLLRLHPLQYEESSPEYRPIELEDMSRRMTEIFAQVPGLIRELAGQAGAADEIFHLRLILSANELALLPFELTNASPGFAGAGQSLLLQSQSAVCITREVRRVATGHLEWPPPPNPKVLFAAASPEAPVPLEEHLLVLRQAIDPWLFYYKDDDERARKIAEHLTVLPRATLHEIEEACATGSYTHIHLLAHGVPLKKGDDRRFGIALHDPIDPDKREVVEGTRLAKALRPPLKNGEPGFARPTVVTLAACDGGSVGSVIGAGASVAHALHEEGIPLVVASQFPLSFPGSVVMAKVLYEGFLLGEDPRSLLVNLRRNLRTYVDSAHDWASIVAYASLPEDIDEKIPQVQIYQAFRRLEAAFNSADRMLAPDANLMTEAMAPKKQRLQRARDQVEKRLNQTPETAQNPLHRGILASADKRLAQILFRMAEARFQAEEEERKKQATPPDSPERREFSLTGPESDEIGDRLITSRKNYAETFRLDRSQAWALVQALVLTLVLRRWDSRENLSTDQWNLARIFSEEELAVGDRTRQAWANANLMELYLLVIVLPDGAGPVSHRIAGEKAVEYARAFRNVVDLSAVEIHSTRRQVLRYESFFARINLDFVATIDLALKLAGEIPESHIFA